MKRDVVSENPRNWVKKLDYNNQNKVLYHKLHAAKPHVDTNCPRLINMHAFRAKPQMDKAIENMFIGRRNEQLLEKLHKIFTVRTPFPNSDRERKASSPQARACSIKTPPAPACTTRHASSPCNGSTRRMANCSADSAMCSLE